MRIELLEQVEDPTSFVRRFLDETTDIARPHHITFKVSDIHRSLDEVKRAGFEPILINFDNDHWKEFFIHPVGTKLGFLTQVVESARSNHEALQESGTGLNPPSSWPTPTGAMASIPYLLGRVEDMEVARALLGTALGGSETAAANGAACFRWERGADLRLTERVEESELGIHTIAFGVDGDRARTDNDHEAGAREPEIGVRVEVLRL
jgi:hypothetical protein